MLLHVGYTRPTDKRPLGLFGAGQSSHHRGWVAPGIIRLLEAVSPDEFFQCAKTTPFPLCTVKPTFPADLNAAISHICELKEGVVAWRLRNSCIFERISKSLRPLSAAMIAGRKPHVAWATGDQSHPALVCALTDAMEWPDFRMAKDLCMEGFNLIGWADDSGLWRLRPESELTAIAATMTPPKQFYRENAARHRLVIRRLQQRFEQNRENLAFMADCQAAWDASMTEVQAGTCQGPFTVSSIEKRFRYGKLRVIGRHVVHQGEKIRAVDDARANGTNAAFASRETVSLMAADCPVAIAQEFYLRSKSESWGIDFTVGGSVDDEKAAYRSIPVRQPELTPVAQVDPATGVVMIFLVRGVNFGIAAAVTGYCRKSAFLVAVARRLFACPVDYFFDDFTIVEPSFSRGEGSRAAAPEPGKSFPGSSQAALWLAASHLGTTLAPNKSQVWSQCCTSCGIVNDFSEVHLSGTVRARVKPSSRRKLLDSLSRAREEDTMPPSLASSLASKYRWVSMTRVGRAATQPIRARQFSLLEDHQGWPISSDKALAAAVDFLLALLHEELPDSIFRGPSSPLPPVLVWSDASWRPVSDKKFGAGMVAFVIYVPRHRAEPLLFFASSEAPGEVLADLFALRAQRSLITSLEEIALASPYGCEEVAASLSGRDVLHFADNTAANAAAIKGYSSSPDLARLVSSMHLRIARLGIRLWIEFVPSALNFADAPSRGDFCELIRLQAVRVPFTFPSLDSWSP